MLLSNQASVSGHTKSYYHSLRNVNMANFIPNIVNLDDDNDLFNELYLIIKLENNLRANEMFSICVKRLYKNLTRQTTLAHLP